MSTTDDSVASNLFVRTITDTDTQLIDEMAKKDSSTRDMYSLFQQRLELYNRALEQKLIPTDRIFLAYKKDLIYTELKMFKFKLDFEEQVSHIVSRLDEMDAQIKDLKNQKQN